MAKGAKPAKVASKNNPAQRRKSTTMKKYGGKDVKPSKYIDDDLKESYMSAVFIEGNKLAYDAYGKPVKWSDL